MVGIDVLDNQHKVIFDLINDLNNAINASSDIRVITTLLDVIENYTFKHFETEEELFKDRKDKDGHLLKHYNLIKELYTFKLAFRNRNLAKEAVPNLMEAWFLDHVTQIDLPFFNQKAASGQRPKMTGKVDDYPLECQERRKHKRISHKKITDTEIVVDCYNTTTLTNSKAMIVDISMGGMRISSDTPYKIGDLVLVSCHIGRSFKMKEKVRIRNITGNSYGAEFISLSPASEGFLAELYGSVNLRNY